MKKQRELDTELRELERRVGFDPAFLCIFCDEPVGALSCGGPMICPACDCGYNKDGTRWTYGEATLRYANARKRMNR